MKLSQPLRLGFLLILSLVHGRAAELFVSPSGGHIAPYTTWLTAATNIQVAIDAATTGDTVTVTNGVYAEGGKVKAGDLTNRIAIDRPILVRSVNGPYFTIVQGAWDSANTNGPGAVRCAWLTNGATLSGFTLRGGATRRNSNLTFGAATNSGGGVWSASRGSLVTNCIITGNAAVYSGGGAFSNTIVNSIIKDNIIAVASSGGIPAGAGTYESVLKNSALLGNRIPNNGFPNSGGGAYRGALTNCTVVGNYALSGAGVSGSSQTPVMNCIIWGNTSPSASATDTNYSSAMTIRYSCSGPLPSGTGNISADPQLLADGIHLASTSPCRGAGNALFTTGSDFEGLSWSSPPSMGCDEWSAEPMLLSQPKIVPGPQGQLQISMASASGQDPIMYSWLKDGATLSGASYGGLDTIRLVINKLGPGDTGSYQLVASNAFGAATSTVAILTIRCVNVAGVSPAAPYTGWSSAATNIQTAIDASAVGDIVLVTNGLYGFGGKVMAGDLTNRVAIDKALIVMSINGARHTTIEGTPGPGGVNSSIPPNNTNAVRCAWLADGAILSGFTLRGGGTRASYTDNLGTGGGAWCSAPSALLSYCNIQENAAYFQGGGVYSGTLNNCAISGNDVGMYNFGFASGSGGGAYNSVLINCLVRANYAAGFGSNPGGGGAYGGMLTNCTVIGNRVLSGVGGGVRDSVIRNCIVRNNSASISGDVSGGSAQYSCIGNAFSGTGNITNDPLFLADGFHISSTSPCRGAGSPTYTTGTDIDGQTWTNPPSMGWDEWLPEPLILDFKMQASHWNQFNFKTLIAGIESSPGYWFKDGTVLSGSSHYLGAETSALAVRGLTSLDSGNYQLIVSNAFGMATSRVAEVTLHFVKVGNPGGVPPFTNWQTAADTIQDAIDVASINDVIVVTNGIYNRGGKALFGWDVTNRVALDKEVVVVSTSGPFQTIIEGGWDPISTNGMNAVRCALVWSNSSLAGFTLQNGATGTNGAGGGVSVYFDELISSCVISNNRAFIGGGGAFGAYNNCWFVNNSASLSGGGATAAKGLNNCTVIGNSAGSASGGANSSGITNSIVWFNSAPVTPNALGVFFNSCSPGLALSSGNIANDPQLVDGLHLAATSPCRGAGAGAILSTTDLDGDAWLVPPSMGADEFPAAGVVGPLSVSIEAPQTTVVANHPLTLVGRMVGQASRVEWDFSDGPVVTNIGYYATHTWTNPGDYLVSFTAFNTDNPAGVTTNVLIHVEPLLSPVLSPVASGSATNFSIQFGGQVGINYLLQYTTNMAAPINWLNLKSLVSTGGVVQITDTAATNSARFYRVRAQ